MSRSSWSRRPGCCSRAGRTAQWFASQCSVVTPGELVAAGGEPRGGVIKVVLGVLILGLVLSWALRRKARGTRPSLPGRSRAVGTPRDALRARPRRGSGPDGQRHRAGRRGLGAARDGQRRRAGSNRSRARDDPTKPREACGEGRRRPRRGAGANRARRRSRARRPADRGGDRGAGGEGGDLPPRRRGLRRRSRPRLQHLLDLDHTARGGHRAAGQGHRHALLQPGTRAEAGRGDPRARDLGRDRGRRSRRSPKTSGRSPPRRATSRASSRTGSSCRS